MVSCDGGGRKAGADDSSEVMAATEPPRPASGPATVFLVREDGECIIPTHLTYPAGGAHQVQQTYSLQQQQPHQLAPHSQQQQQPQQQSQHLHQQQQQYSLNL